MALSGFLQTAYAGASTTTSQLLELDTIADVLVGALIMARLMNSIMLMAVSR